MPFADLTDVRCYYELMGNGEPVLLIPGLGSTCRVWDHVAPELGEIFSVILFDNRDIGYSAAARFAHSLDELSVDIVELLDTLQVEKAHVVGLSLGGLIAQRLAIDHPSRVDRLVLISCANRFTGYLKEMAKLLAHGLRYFPREAFQRTIELLGTSPQYLDAHPEYVEEKLFACKNTGVSRAAMARQLQCINCSDLAAGDFQISSPTLVIAGERDAIIPACYARQMASDIPDSEFILIPDCGHNPLFEKPYIAIPRIIEFLGRSRKLRQMTNSALKVSNV